MCPDDKVFPILAHQPCARVTNARAVHLILRRGQPDDGELSYRSRKHALIGRNVNGGWVTVELGTGDHTLVGI
jgi:hypothetical protein